MPHTQRTSMDEMSSDVRHLSGRDNGAASGAEVLSMPLSVLGLPKRATNALLRSGIMRLSDVTEWTERDLKTLPNFGPTSAHDLQIRLADMGLHLREPCQTPRC